MQGEGQIINTVYRARAMITKKVNHGGVIGQLAELENSIIKLQKTIEKLHTFTHNGRSYLSE